MRMTFYDATLFNLLPEMPKFYSALEQVTNFIPLRSRGIDTYDRSFDAQGKPVWGAGQDDAYEFRWLKVRDLPSLLVFKVYSHR